MRETVEQIKRCRTREETINCIGDLASARSSTIAVDSDGPLVLSDIPAALKNRSTPTILGIDEAGRGPVLGPMIYGCVFWAASDNTNMSKLGFNDSKLLSAKSRKKHFDTMMNDTPTLGLAVRVLHATEISRNMFRADAPYNLNSMSHDAAISLIKAVQNAGVEITHVYIDTVGHPGSYKSKLDRLFEGCGIDFTVEKKADSKFPCCAAASIIAKVCRDEIIGAWEWSEKRYSPTSGTNTDFGSGYPSDPKCKKWLDESLDDPVFCFPDLVRFSWAPAKAAVESKGARVEWESEEREKNNPNGDLLTSNQQTSRNRFLAERGSDSTVHQRKKSRGAIFNQLGLEIVENIFIN